LGLILRFEETGRWENGGELVQDGAYGDDLMDLAILGPDWIRRRILGYGD